MIRMSGELEGGGGGDVVLGLGGGGGGGGGLSVLFTIGSGYHQYSGDIQYCGGKTEPYGGYH